MARRTVSVPVPSASALCMVALLAVGSLVIGGGLNPPVGPVSPTMKTLDEVEPRIAVNATNTPGDADSLYKITAPGSYYLTGNVTGVAGKHGVEIAASGVTLDLNGFDLMGVPGMGAFDGVYVSLAAVGHITVRNGTVRSWGGDGIDADDSPNIRAFIERITASSNSAAGVGAGAGSIISGCMTNDNGDSGIYASFGSRVSACESSFNGNFGVVMSSGGMVSDCNTYNNFLDGISTGSACTVIGCTSDSNGGNGISTGNSATVTQCTASLNAGNGIVASGDCRVVGNNCDSNGFNTADGAGIFVIGSDCRIEGNNCTDNDRGIDVDGPGNILVGNTCSGNTVSWDVAANNVCLVVAPPASVAFTGNTGGTSLSTNPWANFTY